MACNFPAAYCHCVDPDCIGNRPDFAPRSGGRPEGTEERELAAVEIIRRELAKGVKQTEPEVAPYLHAAREIQHALEAAGLLAASPSFTREEAEALLRATGDGRLPDLEVSEAELSAVAKLRALASTGEGDR